MLSTSGARFLNTCGARTKLAANFLEYANNADYCVDAVFCVFDSRNGLLVGHRGSDDREADRLVELERELNTGAGDRMRDHFIVISLALDHCANHHDAFDLLTLEQSFHHRRHVVHAGDSDYARDLDAERLGM